MSAAEIEAISCELLPKVVETFRDHAHQLDAIEHRTQLMARRMWRQHAPGVVAAMDESPQRVRVHRPIGGQCCSAHACGCAHAEQQDVCHGGMETAACEACTWLTPASGFRHGLAVIGLLRANSSSITRTNASSGCAPESTRPLMKNVGVPVTSSRLASSTSF
jgi:hypothetical protein